MRKLYAFLLLLLICCGSEPKQPLTLTIEKTGELQTKLNNQKVLWFAQDKTGYRVLAKIKNNTTRTVYYWIYSCGYQRGFKVNNKAVKVIGQPNCDNDFPSKEELKPHTEDVYEFILVISDADKLKVASKNVKLGLVIIDDIYTQNFSYELLDKYLDLGTTREKPNTIKNIVWSNSVDISK